ncbi:hypothetical protein C5167_028822 [Papaver somniferum]|nr:hypothetical protein C5167_028822 [Papaver somniferum]
MAFVLLLSCVGFLFIALPFPGALYIASVILGFCLGAEALFILTIISELFGLKHYSTLFNCGVLAIPIGSYVFNVKVAGVIYDNEAMKQIEGFGSNSAKGLTCIGTPCYKSTFLIMAAVAFIGTLASLILALKTRKFYQGDIYKKYREDAVANSDETEIEFRGGAGGGGGAVDAGVNELKVGLGMIIKNRKGKNKATAEEHGGGIGGGGGSGVLADGGNEVHVVPVRWRRCC